jgi:phage internal scaffolding protein
MILGINVGSALILNTFREVNKMTIRKRSERVRISKSNLDLNGDPKPSIVQQAHKDHCDVNRIISKYDRTGLLTHVKDSVARYGDFTEVNEYQEALNLVIRAQDSFDDLPSDIRKRFANDPGEFFEFATNPANSDEMYRLGLAVKPSELAVSGPVKVEIVSSETE